MTLLDLHLSTIHLHDVDSGFSVDWALGDDDAPAVPTAPVDAPPARVRPALTLPRLIVLDDTVLPGVPAS